MHAIQQPICLCEAWEPPLSSKQSWNLSPARAILSFAEESSKECEILSLLSAILLGLIQGVAGFANLKLWAFGHRGTYCICPAHQVPGFLMCYCWEPWFAVFIAYWSDIRDGDRTFLRGAGPSAAFPTPAPPARRQILLIIVGTLPLFAVLPIKDSGEPFRQHVFCGGSAPCNWLPAVCQ